MIINYLSLASSIFILTTLFILIFVITYVLVCENDPTEYSTKVKNKRKAPQQANNASGAGPKSSKK